MDIADVLKSHIKKGQEFVKSLLEVAEMAKADTSKSYVRIGLIIRQSGISTHLAKKWAMGKNVDEHFQNHYIHV
jgi:hypothetical protein